MLILLILLLVALTLIGLALLERERRTILRSGGDYEYTGRHRT